MRIAVIGRTGQLAQSLVERANAAGTSVEIVTRARPDFDLAAIGSIQAAIDAVVPDLVVNAAAYTAVDKAESDPDTALLLNGAAAGAIASACAARAIPVVQVSTDYVFDGSKPTPYVETDLTSPINVYGASKTLGEQLVAKANPRHLVLRTSWVISPFGHNFVRTMLRLAAGRDRIAVVDDQYGAPTYAPHLADAILRLALTMASAPATDPRWGIYNVVNRGETTWCGLARSVFEAAAARGAHCPVVDPIATAAYPTPARRPANSRLDTSKLERTFGIALPAWQDGVTACVERLLASTPAR